MASMSPRNRRFSGRSFARSKDQERQRLFRSSRFQIERLEPQTLLAGLPTMIEIVPGSGAPDPAACTNVNNTVFFSAIHGSFGRELWKSDGTIAGTVLVKDIRTGTQGLNPTSLVNVNGTLFL